MSELEIKRRREYKQNRKKWTLIQIIAIAVLAAIALGCFIGYNQMNKTHYIEYMESGSIDYQVHYVPNDFFEEEWIPKDQSYISSLIDQVTADFDYKLDTVSEDMKFDFTHRVDVQLVISSKETGAPYYTLEENLVSEKTVKDVTRLDMSVEIDYNKYDEIARQFVETYGLDHATCVLLVNHNVSISSINTKFEKTTKSQYTNTLNIPVAVDTFSIHRTSSSPEGEVKVLEYKSVADKNFFYVTSIVALVLDILAVAGLFVFLHLTKNEDITYSAKIRKILKSYGSYIQRIDGEFDCTGYQIVMIKTFVELLCIRDTIQSPILAFENKDETMTSFLIPTNTKIIYVFEIKVDNYDQIYANINVSADVDMDEEEEVTILEEVDQDALNDAIAQPDVDLADIEYVPNDDAQHEVPPEEPGIEVVGVVWPERSRKNKVYRYDPNGETLNEGDIVLVPSRDAAQGRDVIRKAAVAHGNHRVAPEHITHPLKKIIAVIKRKPQTTDANDGTDAQS